MAYSNSEKQPVDQIPQRLLDLMLDLVLDVMKAERGSVMLVDPKSQELSIQSARGLNDEVVRNARVRFGTGVAGKVASSGQAVFLKGRKEDRRQSINAEDLKISDIDTSYILPVK
jgi:signal transduction protein with GAF and PtsI domain